MTIKKPVANSMIRVGIDPVLMAERLDNPNKVTAYNRFGGGSCVVNEGIDYLIKWVYSVSNQYETGICDVKISDFDRIRYFILEQDRNAYSTCID
jgi:hypothetical protein